MCLKTNKVNTDYCRSIFNTILPWKWCFTVWWTDFTSTATWFLEYKVWEYSQMEHKDACIVCLTEIAVNELCLSCLVLAFLVFKKTNISCAPRVKQRLTGWEKNKKVKGHQRRTLTLPRAYMVGVGYPVTDMCHLGFMCICMWICVCINYRGQTDFMNDW